MLELFLFYCPYIFCFGKLIQINVYNSTSTFKSVNVSLNYSKLNCAFGLEEWKFRRQYFQARINKLFELGSLTLIFVYWIIIHSQHLPDAFIPSNLQLQWKSILKDWGLKTLCSGLRVATWW